MKLKSYRGLFIIECEVKTCIAGGKTSVIPECMACPKGITKTFDLDGNLIYEHKAEVKKAKKEGKK